MCSNKETKKEKTIEKEKLLELLELKLINKYYSRLFGKMKAIRFPKVAEQIV